MQLVFFLGCLSPEFFAGATLVFSGPNPLSRKRAPSRLTSVDIVTRRRGDPLAPFANPRS